MPTIDTNGITLAFTDTGEPPGRPQAQTIVFGHGTLFGGWMFQQQIEGLRGRFRCVAIDWRAHGDTPAPRTGYDMDTLTDDAAALIAMLGSSPVHWVGLSSGGFVGQRLAIRHGDLLRSLVLLDTCAIAASTRVIRRNELQTRFFRILGPRILRYTIAPLMFSPAYLSSMQGKATVDEWLDQLDHCNRRGVAQAMRAAMTRPSIEHELSHITLPTLVVCGANDVMTPPRLARQMANLIPGAQFEEIPGSGHCSVLEQPTDVTRILERFFWM
ncbi:MAG: alpha/beta hydrolase [Nocardia sp.]|uniref:alpha/beta fold hydrolase n=1 Tax=Nocardia sp. TaxID=1821 RepID=UPI00261243B3|nr:alpha/beta fold hydrolase [Nocardia sp.]MCU1642999.1 alpha/beta hydrolase [Nocardia sp.]